MLFDVVGRETWKIELADAGEGMAKVLPVLVATEAACMGTGPALVAIEDPDVHLHDDATRHLAEHLCARVKEEVATLVIETHSRTLLLAVQNQIKQQHITPGQVRVVWAQQNDNGETTLQPVEFSTAGLPKSSQFRTAFLEDSRLATELAGL